MADSGVYVMDTDAFLSFIDALQEHYNNRGDGDSDD